MPKRKKSPKSVESLKHKDAVRKNIPTAEYQSVMDDEQKSPIELAYERRNRDLDPQLVWRGKDEQDWSDLVVQAPPLYIHEKIHPKVLIDDLQKRTKKAKGEEKEQPDLFGDFNGIPEGEAKTEFYQHDANWTNRIILGDGLQVMASLAEREGLRGQVQSIYIDPPYGIKFNSNFQWSTTSTNVKDGKVEHITREPEQVKAFRDTWRDGIHSYLTYLRDRLTVARDLLKESGSIFVQIGDENVHRVRALMDEIFGEDNFISLITFKKTHYQESDYASNICDYLLFYARDKSQLKFRKLWKPADLKEVNYDKYRKAWDETGKVIKIPMEYRDIPERMPKKWIPFRDDITLTQDGGSESDNVEWEAFGQKFYPGLGRHWRTHLIGLQRLYFANRVNPGDKRPYYIEGYKDSPSVNTQNIWTENLAGAQNKVYVVQTNERVLKKYILMTTDPGDIVLDPTCGSGTTAYVAEEWGRRWITIDTSRVALALARARIMGAKYPYYLLSDSKEGRKKEAELTRTTPSGNPAYGDIRQGFVYKRVPHIMLKDIANNAEIDVIWDQFQEKLEPLSKELNNELRKEWEEWEIPREAEDDWSDKAKQLHAEWWKYRLARQEEIDASIAANSEQEYLYDQSYEDKSKVRVAGPFTVESLSPHRMLAVDENDEFIGGDAKEDGECYGETRDFTQMILENLNMAGVQQAHKEDKISFTSLTPWPGEYICAEGIYQQNENDGKEQRAGILIGPEFGTVSRPDLVASAREAADAGFDVLIACAFNFEAHATEFDKLGRIPVLKARMNADLHMADDLTGKGNLFVIFGEPDVDVVSEEWLVDSKNQKIAPYEIFKILSGVNSLAEINQLKREDLYTYIHISNRREVWNYLTNEKSGDLRTGKHSGGSGPAYNGGVSSVARHCARVAGRSGDVSDYLSGIGNDKQAGLRELAERLRGDQQNAQRPDKVALHSPLTTQHYMQVKVNGVDVFHPQTGEIRSDGADGIACWFIDTDYNEESFFVRHAYFLGAGDPYKSLKRSLKSEINKEAWKTLYSDTSRPFEKPESGHIAVKVINHLGDEVMKVYRVG